jgi:hypothetical protein
MREPLRPPTTFALAGEQLWLRLQGVTPTLPQTRLPNAAALIARPGELGRGRCCDSQVDPHPDKLRTSARTNRN